MVEYSKSEDKVVAVFPACVRYRGFSEDSCTRAYRRVSKYMKDNAAELEIEANE